MGRRSFPAQLTVNLTYRVESLKTLLDPERVNVGERRKQIIRNRQALFFGRPGSRARPRQKGVPQLEQRSEDRTDAQSGGDDEEVEDDPEESDTDDELDPWEREKRMKQRESGGVDTSKYTSPTLREAARRR